MITCSANLRLISSSRGESGFCEKFRTQMLAIAYIVFPMRLLRGKGYKSRLNWFYRGLSPRNQVGTIYAYIRSVRGFYFPSGEEKEPKFSTFHAI
jgi:hypothetical protein